MLVFFILASLWEESITSRPGFRFGWFLTLVQMLCMTGFALAERWVRSQRFNHSQSTLFMLSGSPGSLCLSLLSYIVVSLYSSLNSL